MKVALILVTSVVFITDLLWLVLGREQIPAQFQFDAWVIGVLICAAIQEKP